MPYQTWFADAAREAGLKVQEVQGWQRRGSSSFSPKIVVAHGTVGSAVGNMPSLGILINGRPGLPGPLSQFGLARDGTVYVIAAGRANHAGRGRWAGAEGNTHAVGIEAESTGPGNWTKAQRVVYPVLAAAICRRLGVGHGSVCSHAEYALPRGRKTDVWDLRMDEFRGTVGHLLKHGVRLDPSVEIPSGTPERTLGHNDRGPDVKRWQEDLIHFFAKHSGERALPRFGADGHFGDETVRYTREAQKRLGVDTDGLVGPRTRAALSTWLKSKAQEEARRRAEGLGDETATPVAGPEETTTSQPIPSTPPTSTRVLGKDDKGADVTAWQQDLIRFFSARTGTRALPRFGADGHFGSETVQFTKEAQKLLGVAADGLVGPKTRAAMAAWLSAHGEAAPAPG